MYFCAHCLSPEHQSSSYDWISICFPAKHASSLLPWSLTCCVGLSNLPASCQTLPSEARLILRSPSGGWDSACHMLGTRTLPADIVIACSKGSGSWTVNEASYLSVLSSPSPRAELNFPPEVARSPLQTVDYSLKCFLQREGQTARLLLCPRSLFLPPRNCTQ